MAQGLFRWLLDPVGLVPHGFCLLWNPWLIWFHALGDIGIGLAYFSIPVALLSFARRRRDLAFKPVFWLFAAFILLCGAGHWVDFLTIWVPAYRLDAILKIATAVVSIATAVTLWPLIPSALALPSQRQLRAVNEALTASEARYRTGFLRSPVPLYTLDAEARITGVSDRWLELLGYTRQDVLGRHIAEFWAPGSAVNAEAEWARLLAQGAVQDRERRFIRQDGAVLDVLISGRVERDPRLGTTWVLGSVVDITARKRAERALRASEERLQQTQRMEALGQLTGGIAHDFNNLLTAVLGSLELLARRLHPAEPRIARLLDTAIRGAQRGAGLTQRLLAFGRRQPLRPAPVDVLALVQGMSDLLRTSLGASIESTMRFATGLPAAHVDPSQLELALLNLVVNARDAMPSGGQITIAAREERIGAEDGTLPAGSYVVLSVTDTGDGMDEATLAKATEPFFTTKGVGKGTGLGLSMVDGVAAQSGGRLVLSSQPGQGTTAELWLPRAEIIPAPTGRGASEAWSGPVSRRVVLLVDDDPLVLSSAAAMLDDMGHVVIEAASGRQALDLLRTGGRCDIVVTDYVMPGMTGLELAAEIGRLAPDLAVLLATGYAEAARIDAMGVRLLAKPFERDALAQAVEAAITAKARSLQDAPAAQLTSP